MCLACVSFVVVAMEVYMKPYNSMHIGSSGVFLADWCLCGFLCLFFTYVRMCVRAHMRKDCNCILQDNMCMHVRMYVCVCVCVFVCVCMRAYVGLWII